MCDTIRINNSEKEIETAGEFEKHYGVDPNTLVGDDNKDYIPLLDDCCMCQMDLKKFFTENPQYNGKYEGGYWSADS